MPVLLLLQLLAWVVVGLVMEAVEILCRLMLGRLVALLTLRHHPGPVETQRKEFGSSSSRRDELQQQLLLRGFSLGNGC
jgi:hypothetical protein